MIARFRVLLPYKLSLPETAVLPPHKQKVDGVEVIFHPPYHAKVVFEDSQTLAMNEMQVGLDQEPHPDLTEDIKIGGQRTMFLNALQIDIVRLGEGFDRRRHTAPDEETDPSQDFLFRLANSLIHRLRSVTQAPQICAVSKTMSFWRIDYLADDESELQREEKTVRSIHAGHFVMSAIGISGDTWVAVHDLPVTYKPNVWETILLDAERSLPEVGASLVLAATSLETFIAYSLNIFAEEKATPSDLWTWINGRDDIYKRPAVEEQFDVLLKLLSGKSLKEDKILWEAMNNIKTARNNFVHKGQALYGDHIVDQKEIRLLVARTKEIINWVESFLPTAARRPKMTNPVKMELGRVLMASGVPPMIPAPKSSATPTSV